MNIGIVEDHPTLRAMLTDGFRSLGHETTGYTTAQEAIQPLLNAHHNGQPLPHDVLLVDIRLSGGIDGVELVERLRQHISVDALQIIFVTAEDQASRRVAERHLLDVPLVKKATPKFLNKLLSLMKDPSPTIARING